MRNDFCSNYLEHSAKGKTWANHRYVAKVKLPSGKWFYFYDANAYQNYLKRQGGGDTGQFAKANPNKEMVELAAKNDPNLQNLVKEKSSEKTLEEKTKAMKTNIENGEKKIQEILENTKGSKSKKKGKGGGSSKKKEATIKAKPVRSSKSSKKKDENKKTSKSGKEKKTSNKEKQAQKKEEAVKNNLLNTKTTNEPEKTTSKPFTADSLKKTFGIKDTDVNKHKNTSELVSKIKSYDDGSNGYIIAGDKIYKWSKNDGNITFMDYETDKEVTLGSELNNIQEFVINGKKKK